MRDETLRLLAARDVQAQAILPTLHRQRWSLDADASSTQGRIIQLSAGRAELAHDDGLLALHAPDVIWLPAGSGLSLRVEPGSEGVMVGVSDSVLAAAIGSHADSAALRLLTSHLCHMSAHEPQARAELLRSLRAIDAETRSPSGGSWHYLAAHVAIVLVLMWRLGGRELPRLAAAGQGAQRLRRFRHLVEAQFRNHWSMARYAAELSISADRLHDLCTRNLERTPTALVHQRLVHEACVLLGASDLSIDRLSGDLGFASASHFSRFFKRWMSVGPKAYREHLRATVAKGQATAPVSYADWP